MNANGNGIHLKINSALIVMLIVGAISAYIAVRIELVAVSEQHKEMMRRLDRIEAKP